MLTWDKRYYTGSLPTAETCCWCGNMGVKWGYKSKVLHYRNRIFTAQKKTFNWWNNKKLDTICCRKTLPNNYVIAAYNSHVCQLCMEGYKILLQNALIKNDPNRVLPYKYI